MSNVFDLHYRGRVYLAVDSSYCEATLYSYGISAAKTCLCAVRTVEATTKLQQERATFAFTLLHLS